MKNKHIAIEVSRDEHYKTPYLQSLKESWPSLAKDYRHYCHNNHPKAGEVWTWTSPEGQMFFHLILDEDGQLQAHDKAHNEERLHNFKKALKNLKKEIKPEETAVIEMPKGGFSFTNDDFPVAQSIIKETFSDTKAEVKFV